MRYNPYEDREDDCFYQPGNLYRLMTEDKRLLLLNNTVADIMPVSENVKLRHCAHCYLADVEYGSRLAKMLNLDLKVVKGLAEMSQQERFEATSSC
jgi:catalase